MKTPRVGGTDTLFFLSWLLAFSFAMEGFEVSSRSPVWVNSDHETKSHLFFTNFFNVHFFPTLGPGKLGWISGVVPM